ncbi:MAG: hypothetical protein ACKVRN_16840 [Pyrinomonadaceae bacterium]
MICGVRIIRGQVFPVLLDETEVTESKKTVDSTDEIGASESHNLSDEDVAD